MKLNFLFLALFCVAVEAFFSMFEMASVSFNKARLAYYTSKKKKKALWLDYLLKRPSRLFGTTLIAVNTALEIGSEAARRFYDSVGICPDFAPLSQVLLIVIFGELSPLFAARRYPERVALFNVPVVYFFSKIFAPFTWIIDKISASANSLLGEKEPDQLYLTKDEIQKAFEEKEISRDADINRTVSGIFSLKNITAKKLMVPLSSTLLIPSDFNLNMVKEEIRKNVSLFALIYHQTATNIISVVMIRDLLRASPLDPIKNFGQSPWFITENLSILEILKQFRRNRQTVAIILDQSGLPAGLITLDMEIFQIFGPISPKIDEKKEKVGRKIKGQMLLEKTLSGEMLVKDFNKKYKGDLPEEEETLSDLVNAALGHPPSEGEKVEIGSFDFMVKEASLLGSKRLLIRSLR
jgi:putative hemolysin